MTAPLSDLTADWATGIDTDDWSYLRTTWSAGQVSLQPTFDGPYGAYVVSDATYDLTGDALTVQFLAPPTPNGSAAEAYVQLIDLTSVVLELMPAYSSEPALGADGLFWLWVTGAPGTLVAARRVAGQERWLAELAYDVAEHAWLRIREAGSVVYWETAPDGLTWTIRAAWAPTIDVTALTVDLRAGFWSPWEGGIPGPTVFGTVNLPPETVADPVTISAGDGLPYLAVDVIPELDAATFTVALDENDVLGTFVDGDDLLGWAQLEEGAWTNIVCDVSSVQIRRGSTRLQGARTRAEAASVTVVLTDTSRRFDPMTNADAIHRNTPVRVRAWGYDLAGDRWDAVLVTGSIQELHTRYLRDDYPEVTVLASDRIADLAGWQSAGYAEPGVGGGDDLLARAERVLDEMGLVSDDVLSWDVDVHGYAASHPDTVLASPWAELAAAEDAELGAVWVDRHNRFTVRTRRSELSGPVRGTLSDVHGDADPGTPHVCYDALAVTLGTEQTTNRAIGQRRQPDDGTSPPEPATITVEDMVSGHRWGWSVTEERSLELETDDQVIAWADDLVALNGTPELRVDSVSPAPSADDLDSALEAWPAVCATDLGDRWAVRHRPFVGQPVDRTVGVLGIEWNLTPDAWDVLFHTVDAPAVTEGNPSGYFLLDDSDVDSGDVLWPWSGAEPYQRF